MQQFFQQVVSGLASGAIYAALALALVLIYRSTGVINFAQGEMATFTTFIAWSLMEHHGISYWPAFFLTLAIAFAGGVLVQRVLIRPFERAGPLTVVIATIGLLLCLNSLAGLVWHTDQKTLQSPFPTRPVSVGGVAMSILDLGTIAVVLGTVVGLWAFFRFTKIGLAMRAAALQPASSRLHGVRVGWMLALGWGLAAVLGAVAGLLTAPTQGSFDQNLMLSVLIYAFAAAVLGGLESPLGAVVGGLSLGVGLNLLGTYVGFVTSELRLPVALAVLVAVLLVRPSGLFGRRMVRKV
ncbi:MAG: branched-chain amino acid ABC transporter permease [Gaiellaceae bacterium]